MNRFKKLLVLASRLSFLYSPDVNGLNAIPIYKFLKSNKGGLFGWNFSKFLVDKDGNVVDRYAPMTSLSVLRWCGYLKKCHEGLQPQPQIPNLHASTVERKGDSVALSISIIGF